MEFKKNFIKRYLLNSIIFPSILFGITFNVQKSSSKTQEIIDIPEVVSYRSASCVCCKKWVTHLQNNGFKVVDNIIENVYVIKKKYKIPNYLRSCHTAKIGNYIIEGHIPDKSIKKLIKEKPSISGIAVPGMPYGSPGMEAHSHKSHSHNYENYKVISFSNNGKTKIFDRISP